MEAFQSLSGESTAELKAKGSRFIAVACPAYSEDEIIEKIKTLRESHPKANHICNAWRLGADGLLYRAEDDGEPRGSAGLPIYNQIRSFNLTDVVVAVIRYFGGTKLGVPGLISAYKEAAKLALEKCDAIKVDRRTTLNIKTAIENAGLFFAAIRTTEVELVNQQYKTDFEAIVKGEAPAIHQLESALHALGVFTFT